MVAINHASKREAHPISHYSAPQDAMAYGTQWMEIKPTIFTVIHDFFQVY